MLILWVFLLVITLSNTLPNFVFILTDDQDLTLHSMDFMKNTVELVANKGITFTNFFVNSPICCPSRSTILTGKYSHNVRVFNNSISGGCSSPQWQQQHENATIASILKSERNYRTFYAGKYLNQYGSVEAGGTQHVPLGYDWWLGLQGNSKYYNYTLSINGSEHFFKNDYFTDKITEYALDFLNQKFHVGDNFFMMLAPPACHSPFTPAPRHRGKFPNLKTIRTLPFNVTPIDKHWIVGMPPKHLPTNITILDDIYRNRLRTLQAVDEMIVKIVAKLTEIDAIDETYIFFTSDNGFHIGQFTQPWDKRQPYESDIHVPLMVRGPKIASKQLTDYPVAAVDIAATILDLAGVKMVNSDGQSFKNQLFEVQDVYDRNILIEYWGEGDKDSIDPQCPWNQDGNLAECTVDSWCKCQDSKNNTYSCVLHISNDVKLKFCYFYMENTVEIYDLIRDPHEMNNLKLDEDEFAYYLEILNKMKSY